MKTKFRTHVLLFVCALLLNACFPGNLTPETTNTELSPAGTESAATATQAPLATATVPMPTSTITSTATPAATTVTVSVPGDQCWVDSGVELNAGDVVFLSASGLINTWEGRVGSSSDPDGQYKKVCGDVKCPLQGADYGALIGRVGDGETFLLGTSQDFNVIEAGNLYLTVNDWGCSDNNGEYVAVITYGKELIPTSTPEHEGSWNLALNQPVNASRSEAEKPPKYAVDGNLSTDWGSGGPPPQWIEIDLGAPSRVERVNMLVTQYPNGETVHRILFRAVDGEFIEVHRFEGSTGTGDWLEFIPDEPFENIQFIRIETVKSPSWVGWIEIEVFSGE